MTTEVPLDFGLLAVKSNTTVSTLQLSSSGVVTFTDQLIPIGGAIRGEYRLAGFPPGVLLELSWDDAVLSAGGGGLPELLQVTNYDNPTLVSDALGEALVPVGAQLKTNASGVMYIDAPYSGSIPLRVRYWSDAAQAYLTHSDSVSFTAQLQSAINLTESQRLSFGNISAYADPAAQASLTLDTNGNVNITSSGNARITPLGGAQAAIIQLSGAAPNYSVTITPEAGNIFLTHELTPAVDAARFIAGSFTTAPSGTSAITNSAGELNIFVGATLTTELTNKVYENGTYNGTYSLTVSY